MVNQDEVQQAYFRNKQVSMLGVGIKYQGSRNQAPVICNIQQWHKTWHCCCLHRIPKNSKLDPVRSPWGQTCPHSQWWVCCSVQKQIPVFKHCQSWGRLWPHSKLALHSYWSWKIRGWWHQWSSEKTGQRREPETGGQKFYNLSRGVFKVHGDSQNIFFYWQIQSYSPIKHFWRSARNK